MVEKNKMNIVQFFTISPRLVKVFRTTRREVCDKARKSVSISSRGVYIFLQLNSNCSDHFKSMLSIQGRQICASHYEILARSKCGYHS